MENCKTAGWGLFESGSYYSDEVLELKEINIRSLAIAVDCGKMCASAMPNHNLTKNHFLCPVGVGNSKPIIQVRYRSK